METEVQKKKGTKQTEMIIGTAAHKIAQASKSYEQAMLEIAKLPQTIETYTLQVTNLEAKIQELKVEYAEKKRQHDVELEIAKREDITNLVTTYLAAQSKTAIEISELNRLKDELAQYKADMEKTIAAEVGRTKGVLENNHKNDLALREAMFNAKEAENKATINSLTSQLTAAREDANAWKKALDAEREAGVKRSQANSIGSVNIAQPGR